MIGFSGDAISKIAAAFTADDKKIERLRASLQEYVDYDVLSSDCPNCYMCNEGRADGDTDQCIHQKAVALLAEMPPANVMIEEKP